MYGNSAQVNPQNIDIDIGNVIGDVIKGVILSTLSASPQGLRPQSNGSMSPQGIDIGEIVKAVLPHVLGALSAKPQMAPQMSIGGGLTFNPFSSAPAVSPQGIDIGDVIKTVLPIVLSALSAGPQGPRLQSSGPLSPQGIDIGDVIKAVLPLYLVVRPTANGSANERRRRSHVQSVLIRACRNVPWASILETCSRRFCPIAFRNLSAGPQGPRLQSSGPLSPPGDRYRRCHQSGVASYLVVRPTANERRRRVSRSIRSHPRLP